MKDIIIRKRLEEGELCCRYVDSGSKPLLLLIHGWATSKKFWYPFIRRLSIYYNLLIPDVANFGKSKLEDGYSLGKSAGLIKSFLLKEGIHTDFILGHSMGGAVAAMLISRHNVTPTKLILSNPVLDGRRALHLRNKILSRTFLKFLVYFFYRFDAGKILLARDFKNIEKASREVVIDLRSQLYTSLMASLKEILRLDLIGSIKTIDIPYRIVLNWNDPIITEDHNELVRSSINANSVINLPEELHCPMYAGNNDNYFMFINDFFLKG